MATFRQRAKIIFNSTVDNILKKYEDPEKMIDGLIIEGSKDLAEVKDRLNSAGANVNVARQDMEKLEKSINDWETAAKNALRSGNEEDARKIIENQSKEQSKLEVYQKNLAVHEENLEIVREEYNECAEYLSDLKSKRDVIKSTANATRSIKITQGNKKMDYEAGKAYLDDLADRTNYEFEKAKESRKNKQHEKANTTDLKEKYLSGGDVDEKLAKLKESLGLTE